ncbi:hypothetical protein IAT38_007652 [Cryptococcus sp. DSM 104549]
MAATNMMEIDAEEESMNAGPSTIASEEGSKSGEAMSKSAMKRAAKKARMAEVKPLKRAAEKERRRIRHAQLSEGYAAGTLSAEDKDIYERRRRVEKERRIASKAFKSGEQSEDWKGGVVIDLGFDELMSENEIASLAGQLGFLYSSNRTAKRPVRTVLHTTFSPTASPKLWTRMEGYNWEKWQRDHWWAEGLDTLKQALEAPQADAVETGPEAEGAAKEGLESFLTGPRLPVDLLAGKHKLVYLSADAEEEISTLSEDEIYIIGGIVDKNRYKNLCQEKAEKLGIRTARLPIGTYLSNMQTRKVLTVNQVFDIIVQYLHLQDWAAAFEAVIPQRKFGPSKRERRGRSDSVDVKPSGAEEGEDDRDDSRQADEGQVAEDGVAAETVLST